jgi:uncharacterized damage-inducible protein DinB
MGKIQNITDMNTRKWFDRKFDFGSVTGNYAAIIKRLKETAGRIEELTAHQPEELLEYKPQGNWSVKEQTGHLYILEPVWRVRFGDIREEKEQLTAADLQNRATTEAGFNSYDIKKIISLFAKERNATVSYLEQLEEPDHKKTSMHPRLQQPMRIADLAYFVAEHDEHHIGKITEILQGLSQ